MTDKETTATVESPRRKRGRPRGRVTTHDDGETLVPAKVRMLAYAAAVVLALWLVGVFARRYLEPVAVVDAPEPLNDVHAHKIGQRVGAVEERTAHAFASVDQALTLFDERLARIESAMRPPNAGTPEPDMS